MSLIKTNKNILIIKEKISYGQRDVKDRDSDDGVWSRWEWGEDGDWWGWLDIETFFFFLHIFLIIFSDSFVLFKKSETLNVVISLFSIFSFYLFKENDTFTISYVFNK